MMDAKDKAVNGLTSGIEGLFKKNGVCIIFNSFFFFNNLFYNHLFNYLFILVNIG